MVCSSLLSSLSLPSGESLHSTLILFSEALYDRFECPKLESLPHLSELIVQPAGVSNDMYVRTSVAARAGRREEISVSRSCR
jgi:hypothetical protein